MGAGDFGAVVGAFPFLPPEGPSLPARRALLYLPARRALRYPPGGPPSLYPVGGPVSSYPLSRSEDLFLPASRTFFYPLGGSFSTRLEVPLLTRLEDLSLPALRGRSGLEEVA